MSPSVIRALNTTSKVVFPSPASGNGFQCLYTSARQHLYSTSAAQKNHMPSISRASERKLCSQGCFATRKYHSLPQPSHSFPPRPIHRSQLPNRSTQRGYKTVEGARSGYKIGVSSAHPPLLPFPFIPRNFAEQPSSPPALLHHLRRRLPIDRPRHDHVFPIRKGASGTEADRGCVQGGGQTEGWREV